MARNVVGRGMVGYSKARQGKARTMVRLSAAGHGAARQGAGRVA